MDDDMMYVLAIMAVVLLVIIILYAIIVNRKILSPSSYLASDSEAVGGYYDGGAKAEKGESTGMKEYIPTKRAVQYHVDDDKFKDIKAGKKKEDIHAEGKYLEHLAPGDIIVYYTNTDAVAYVVDGKPTKGLSASDAENADKLSFLEKEVKSDKQYIKFGVKPYCGK